MHKSWCQRSRAAAALVPSSKISPATLPEIRTACIHDSCPSTSDGGGDGFAFTRVAMMSRPENELNPTNGDFISCMLAAGGCIYTASENEIVVYTAEHIAAHRITVKSPVKALAVSGNRIFSAHKDNKVRVWEKSSNPNQHDSITNENNNNFKLAATLPRMRQRLVSSLYADNYVQIRRHHKKLWLQHADAVSALAVSETNGLLYSASWDKTVKVWRLSDLKCVESITAHHDAVNALLVVNGNSNSNNSEWLYTASSDGSVKVWMREDGDKKHKHKLVGSIEGGHAKSASVNAIAVSHNPNLLWSAGSDGAILGWGLKNNKASDVAEYDLKAVKLSCGGGSGAAVVSLRTKGNVLFSVGSLERAVRVWTVNDRTNFVNGRPRRYEYELTCVGILGGAPYHLRSICVSDCGRWLYGGCADRAVHAWVLSEVSQLSDGSLKSSLGWH